MNRKVSQTAERKPELACKHHWVLESPNGPVSRGVCKKCGEEREFRNSLDYVPATDEKLNLKPQLGAMRLILEDEEFSEN